ncbi:MAG: hypothetical protein PS018_26440 [bacterium]|nr:hypothetical protein [bacterium]
MSALITWVLTNPTILAAVAGAVALIASAWAALRGAKKAGIDEQKAKEAEARAKNLDRIKRAADARPSGSLHNDPRNRDG